MVAVKACDWHIKPINNLWLDHLKLIIIEKGRVKKAKNQANHLVLKN